MSQYPYQQGSPGYPPPVQQFIVAPPPTNGLGVAGFVTSLIGVVTCGFLSPIGLLFSLVGLTRRPRGLAIAGTVLGALGSLWLFVAGFAMVMGLLGLSRAAQTVAEMVAARAASQQAYKAVVQYRAQNGSLPADDAGTRLISSHVDPWKTPLVYRRTGDTFKIVSLGKDKTEGTSDDMSFTESELRGSSPTASPGAAPAGG